MERHRDNRTGRDQQVRSGRSGGRPDRRRPSQGRPAVRGTADEASGGPEAVTAAPEPKRTAAEEADSGARGEKGEADPVGAAPVAPGEEKKVRFQEENMEVGAVHPDKVESRIALHHGMAVADEGIELIVPE
eukprot:4957592-Amphidinium_carterae.1